MDELYEGPSLEASLDDLKAVFRVLDAHCNEHPELRQNAFLESLRRLLEAQARADGIDPADPAQWTEWLAEESGDEDPSRDVLN